MVHENVDVFTAKTSPVHRRLVTYMTTTRHANVEISSKTFYGLFLFVCFTFNTFAKLDGRTVLAKTFRFADESVGRL